MIGPVIYDGANPDLPTTIVDHDEDDGSGHLAIMVSVLDPDGTQTSSHKHLSLDADDEQVADALVHCVLGAAAVRGSLNLVVAVVNRMRQEINR